MQANSSRRFAAGLIAVLVGVTLLSATPASADIKNAEVVDSSYKTIIMLFVLALLIESGLAVIFNWRLYLQVFNGRGVKTLVMIAVSLVLVFVLNIDALSPLLKAYDLNTAGNGGGPVIGKIVTAFILAGGSNGVNRLLVRLGYRKLNPPEETKPAPKSTKAWVSVKVDREQAVGDIQVRIQEQDSAKDAVALAGVIGRTGFREQVKGVFFRDPDRFPQSGGHELEAGKPYEIKVSAQDADGQAIPCPFDGTYVFASKAIIDFRATL